MLQIARQLELEGLRITWSYVARCMSKSKRTAQELRLRLASLKHPFASTVVEVMWTPLVGAVVEAYVAPVVSLSRLVKLFKVVARPGTEAATVVEVRSIGSVAHTTSNDKQLAVGLESVVVATVEVETPRLSLLLLAMFAELAAALSPAIVGASVAQAVLRLAEKTEIWATIEAGLVGVVVALSGSSALMDGALLVVLCVAVRLLLPHADRSGTNDGQDV
ncbi:hypothetical protein PC128_g18073 [Phytophthora cactorum]|nr:hypothetical protein PC128_g18073 [Phytophthora cactorum]